MAEPGLGGHPPTASVAFIAVDDQASHAVGKGGGRGGDDGPGGQTATGAVGTDPVADLGRALAPIGQAALADRLARFLDGVEEIRSGRERGVHVVEETVEMGQVLGYS